MLKTSFKFLFAASFVVAATFTAATAQIGNGSAVHVTIDHSFIIRDKSFTAGKYVISNIDDFGGAANILKIQSLDGKASIAFQTIGEELNEPAKETALVFDRPGDEYFLSKILVKGDTEGTEVEKSGAKKTALTDASEN
ncbi:MAG: hypothetical protein ABI999_03685 [Acidobacteriota bacterium]